MLRLEICNYQKVVGIASQEILLTWDTTNQEGLQRRNYTVPT